MTQFAYGQIQLVKNGESLYKIVIGDGSKNEKAAEVLADYIQKITGAKLPIIKDKEKSQQFEIRVGATNRFNTIQFIAEDGFILRTSDNALNIYALTPQSTLNGVYHFLDFYLGCRKFAPELTYIPTSANIILSNINDLQEPQFIFRQIYYPSQYDEEYRNWHKLHLIENQWGLWGHTFYKLVPSKSYFNDHPEYYALVEEKRSPVQLCLSNPNTLNIVVKQLAVLMAAEPNKKLWSVSQNDGFGYCTCDLCKATDDKYGGPQGSIVAFANKVAAYFPKKTISTLAYLYSKHPVKNLKVADNVSIMLSSIDMTRTEPISLNNRANGFRNDVLGWKAVTSNLMLWDYVVQFTNYFSPFPNLQTLQPNMVYFAQSGFNGIFEQGTESGPGEFSELKSYLLSRLAWNPKAQIEKDKAEFMQAWYGAASPYMMKYQELLEQNIFTAGKNLDIYGGPVAEWNSWLQPAQIEIYSELLDQAATAVNKDTTLSKRVNKEYLALDYAVLQQARFYGLEKHGVFMRNGNKWAVRDGFEQKINRFVNSANANGIKELSEGGLSPDAYGKEWQSILKQGPLLHKALGIPVEFIQPFNTDYPAKGNHTLTDGIPGYNNLQYNYLGWYKTDMEIVIDLGKPTKINSITAGFLEDQRHWAFLPKQVTISFSNDKNIFDNQLKALQAIPEENYIKETHRIRFNIPKEIIARYIRLKAEKLDKIPEWRNFPNRYSWIFCDEVQVD
ncbi:MAG: DUF4838 domain-containing protein [Bacteroidetes bacterium]|nr:DUF4838 domain-containing protein [Bacteroidota bacterium]MBU1372727.1 DUF4838 domain-containing protein [Bacteroidota bacterium]MBU1484923.1 DUF4838 domain-containing protein [Bacteroidota bacterium]MBU1759897.1 DUF4838 domain-containing protein [Bacteroidota bacterium]MBU2374924.1 DUF4838 domain-containing protein [Bacteroidota bacterium]